MKPPMKLSELFFFSALGPEKSRDNTFFSAHGPEKKYSREAN